MVFLWIRQHLATTLLPSNIIGLHHLSHCCAFTPDCPHSTLRPCRTNALSAATCPSNGKLQRNERLLVQYAPTAVTKLELCNAPVLHFISACVHVCQDTPWVHRTWGALSLSVPEVLCALCRKNYQFLRFCTCTPSFPVSTHTQQKFYG